MKKSYQVGGVVYLKKTSNIENFLSLKDKKIGVVKKDIYTKNFLNEAKEFDTNMEIVEFDSYDDIFTAIKRNEVFAGVGGRLLSYSMHEKFSDIKPSSIIFKPINITFALNSHNIALKKLLDKSLSTYKVGEDSQYYKTLNQYLSIKNDAGYLKKALFFALVLFGLIILLLIANMFLKKKIKKATKEIVLAKKNLKVNLQEQIYLTNIISTVKDVNKILLLEEGIHKKLQLICDRVVSNKLYYFCWISLIDEEKNIIVESKSEGSFGGFTHEFKTKFDEYSLYTLPCINTSCENVKTVVKDVVDEYDFSCFLTTPICIKKNIVASISVLGINEDGFTYKEIELIKELAGDIGLWLSLEEAEREGEKNYEQIVYSLVKTIETRDPYTAGHDNRVANYCRKLAEALKINEYDIKILEKAAALHDIGKIKIPDAILLKPGSLSHLEYEIIKEHARVGYEILLEMPFLKDEAIVVLNHHERYDGSGYPSALKGEDIPILSQILSIADTFDAMTTNRIYKQGKTKEVAIKELESLRDIWFSSQIMEGAIAVFKEIDLESNICFLPINTLEEARFSYFFKDPIAQCYNKNFLKHIFIENEHPSFNYLYAISLKNFTQYNSKFGWDAGDEFLANFAQFLAEFFDTNKVFRIKGDDFIVLTKKIYNIKNEDILSKALFNNKILDVNVNITEISQIKNIKDLSNIMKTI